MFRALFNLLAGLVRRLLDKVRGRVHFLVPVSTRHAVLTVTVRNR